MPDRPRNGAPEDGPDYHWLYGGADPDQPERPERPDQTRMMRTQPRPPTQPPTQPPRAATRPTPPPVAPPVQPPRTPPPPRGRGPRPRWRRPRLRLRYLPLLLVLWLVFVAATPIIAWRQVEKAAFEPGGNRPASQPGTTYLLVGSDSRAGLTKEQRQELNTGNASGARTDTIMLMHTGSGPNLLMSIPRDLEVDIPGRAESKINAAYAFGGAKLLVRTVEALTGIRVDQYVEIGMGGVVGVVDAVGGIEICPDARMVDEDAGLNIKKGCQQVDGATALAYSRSRHAQRLGDLDRVRHQREVIAAIGHKVLSPWSVINPIRWWRLNNAMPDFFVFGRDTNPAGALRWASAMSRLGGSGGLLCTVPLTDGSATTLDEDRAQELFAKIIADDTDGVTGQLCLPSGIAGIG